MSETESTEAKISRKRKGQFPAPRKSFWWTEDLKMLTAGYLRDNYERYLKSSPRLNFLRKMRSDIGLLGCSDKQLTNGFESLIKKYKETKEKLNSSGFGVDPDRDKSLDKGWVLKTCPHFDILDQVMGTRPNITPPFTLVSSGFGQIGENVNVVVEDEVLPEINTGVQGSSPDVDDFEEFQSTLLMESASNTKTHSKSTCGDDIQNVTINNSSKTASGSKPELGKYVRSTFSGLGVTTSKPLGVPKNALGTFAEIMSTKMGDYKEVEFKKLNFETHKLKQSLLIQKEIETLKVNKKAEIEAEKRRQEREIQTNVLEDKRAERAFEISKLEKQHEFELKKLELQITLERLRNPRPD